MTKAASTSNPSKLIDAHIKDLGGWRGETLARIGALINEADPAVLEEWKWDIPVWSHDGIICTGETYKSAVKTTFARGAVLSDPAKFFNSSLEGNVDSSGHGASALADACQPDDRAPGRRQAFELR